VSEAVKVDETITKWDGYALFDKDYVLLNSELFYDLDTAKQRTECYEKDSCDVWKVVLERKSVVGDEPTEPCAKRTPKKIELELVKGEI
jgi:hypothetical protein